MYGNVLSAPERQFVICYFGSKGPGKTMKSTFPVVAGLILASVCIRGQVPSPAFEAASVKPASQSAPMISCSGGPTTSDPGLWRCSNTPLGFLISQAFGFEAYQFRPNDPCCGERFDFSAKVPDGTTNQEFHQMMQNLLEDRFKLKLHFEKKEMAIYNLVVAESGLKMKETAADALLEPNDPWSPSQFTVGKDGYPIFPAGHGGLAGMKGHYLWIGTNVSLHEITKTLSFYLRRPVVDATGLTGKYNVHLKWWIDIAWALEQAGYPDVAENLPDQGAPGPPLIRAVQDQLGLKLISGRGFGDIVVIDHREKAPTGN